LTLTNPRCRTSNWLRSRLLCVCTDICICIATGKKTHTRIKLCEGWSPALLPVCWGLS